MIFEAASLFAGELASGTPRMPEDWVRQWVAKMSGRERWPADWHRKLVADWRVEFKTWGSGGKKMQKNAARERWQIEADLETVRQQIKGHSKLTWPANKPLPEKIAAEFEALVGRRKLLEKELK
jgi:hypothetical protein